MENTLTEILRPSLLKSDTIWPRYINFKTDRLISTFRILPIFGLLIFIMRVHGIICNYEEIIAEYKLKWSHFVYFQTTKYIKLNIWDVGMSNIFQ